MMLPGYGAVKKTSIPNQLPNLDSYQSQKRNCRRLTLHPQTPTSTTRGTLQNWQTAILASTTNQEEKETILLGLPHGTVSPMGWYVEQEEKKGDATEGLVGR